MIKKISSLILFLGICLSVGALGGLATASSVTTWYAGLQKPPLNPPSWIFAPVWTTLYVLMGIAGWKIWEVKTSDKNRLRFLFAAQLLLNGVWSFLFFGLRNPWISLADILLLWITLLVLTTGAWRTVRLSGLLLMPYLLWVSFAVYLNAAIGWLNR